VSADRRSATHENRCILASLHEEVVQWAHTSSTTGPTFSSMSKRRYGYPSESRVKRGDRIVHGNKELIRKAWTKGPVSMWFGATLSRTAA
jgi:hypothetical protein